MSKKPTKSKPKPKQPAAKTVIMYGLDKDIKPHAARSHRRKRSAASKSSGCYGYAPRCASNKKRL